jgi:hypothetical protein
MNTRCDVIRQQVGGDSIHSIDEHLLNPSSSRMLFSSSKVTRFSEMQSLKPELEMTSTDRGTQKTSNLEHF